MKLLILKNELPFLYNSQRDKTIMPSKLPHLPVTKSTNAPVSFPHSFYNKSSYQTPTCPAAGKLNVPLLGVLDTSSMV